MEVIDRLPPPPGVDDEGTWSDAARFYLIGIGGRGEGALREIGVWDQIEPYSAVVRGRKDWAPGAGVDGGVETIRNDRPPSHVIQRDRLVACLLKAAEEAGVSVRHETDVTAIRWEETDEGEEAVLLCSPCDEACAVDEAGADASREFELRAPFVVAADGVRRTVGDAMEAEDAAKRWVMPGRRFRIKRYEDTAVRVYKTVPFTPPKDWRCDINYSARTAAANFDALPTLSGTYCGVLLIKPDDALTQGLPDVPAARQYFDELLPQFSPMISDEALQAVITKPPSFLPKFRFAGPRLHRGASTVLLGDAIHSVKPYFGLGVNSAFEDVVALGRALDEAPTVGSALRRYSSRRAPEARVLVSLSRSFDFRGLRSFASFIGPIILDGIFHSALPAVFAPNTLAMLQKPELSFVHVRWRKRADRALQLALLATLATAAARLAAAALAAATAALGRTALGASVPPFLRPLLVCLPALGSALALAGRRRSVGGDVADVLAAQTTPAEPEADEGPAELTASSASGGGTRPGY